MKTYVELVTQVDELRAKQRELTMKDDPTQGELDELWILEGRITELDARAREMHAYEVEAAKAETLKSVATTSAITGGVLRHMPKDVEYEIRTLLEGSGSGSYLVPDEFHSTVEEYRREANFLRQTGATVIKTESTHKIPILSDPGAAAIVAENNAYSSSDPTVVQKTLDAFKLTKKVPVSEELLEDSGYDVDAMLARAYGLAFGEGEENYFLVGTGSGQPTGIFNKTADKTLAGATAITKDELIEVVYGLPRKYRRGAVWMMNDTTVLYVAKLKLDVTTSGTLFYFWTDAVGGEPPKLLGYPVYTNSNIAEIASTNKTLCLGCPPMYAIGERGPMTVKRLVLNEYSDTFCGRHRIDGKPLDDAAFYVVKQAT